MSLSRRTPPGYVVRPGWLIVHTKACDLYDRAVGLTISWLWRQPGDKACEVCLPDGLPPVVDVDAPVVAEQVPVAPVPAVEVTSPAPVAMSEVLADPAPDLDISAPDINLNEPDPLVDVPNTTRGKPDQFVQAPVVAAETGWLF